MSLANNNYLVLSYTILLYSIPVATVDLREISRGNVALSAVKGWSIHRLRARLSHARNWSADTLQRVSHEWERTVAEVDNSSGLGYISVNKRTQDSFLFFLPRVTRTCPSRAAGETPGRGCTSERVCVVVRQDVPRRWYHHRRRRRMYGKRRQPELADYAIRLPSSGEEVCLACQHTSMVQVSKRAKRPTSDDKGVAAAALIAVREMTIAREWGLLWVTVEQRYSPCFLCCRCWRTCQLMCVW